MNSSNADLSAFNGVEQNGALQTQEEQEATEDIRRRQEEVSYYLNSKRVTNKMLTVAGTN